jgi:hypothetical protein
MCAVRRTGIFASPQRRTWLWVLGIGLVLACVQAARVHATSVRLGYLAGAALIVIALVATLGTELKLEPSRIVDRVGLWPRAINWSDVEDFGVARPGGIWPGVTVIAATKSGKDFPLLSLTIDLVPSSGLSHEKLRSIASQLNSVLATGRAEGEPQDS